MHDVIRRTRERAVAASTAYQDGGDVVRRVFEMLNALEVAGELSTEAVRQLETLGAFLDHATVTWRASFELLDAACDVTVALARGEVGDAAAGGRQAAAYLKVVRGKPRLE